MKIDVDASILEDSNNSTLVAINLIEILEEYLEDINILIEESKNPEYVNAVLARLKTKNTRYKALICTISDLLQENVNQNNEAINKAYLDAQLNEGNAKHNTTDQGGK